MNDRIAVLSNVNMDFVIRLLKKEHEVYDGEGYGNELGLLMNPQSSYHAFQPQITFLVMDLMEVLKHDLESVPGQDGEAGHVPLLSGSEASCGAPESSRAGIASVDRWFDGLESSLKPECLYYVSDAYLWGPELKVHHDPDRKRLLEAAWQRRLNSFCKEHSNVFILPYHHMIELLGEENAFSLKMWYMGRILHTNEAQKRLSGLIAKEAALQSRIPKKVLLLDLDNTLWGGLAGEAEHEPIALSEEKAGLAYKNLQRVILQLQRQGVLLGIVSKNNEEDAMEILRNHPHCVLRPECFAAYRINWEPKHENILQIARELNLGVDSFVFWDDQPAERELVKKLLPQVAVPDFPEKPEELAEAMVQIYHTYFEKAAVTEEDLEKTKQYADNARRNSLQSAAGSFEEYLKQLRIVITRKEPAENIVRLTQLVNKTNQFNLTTVRYDQAGLQQIIRDSGKMVFLYNVEDCFGDNGIVAAGIVDLKTDSQPEKREDGSLIKAASPVIEELVMSCRVMGKNVEYAIVEDMENVLQREGYTSLRAVYVPTAKNKPVEQLFEKLGYRLVSRTQDGRKNYEIDLANRPPRVYYTKMK